MGDWMVKNRVGHKSSNWKGGRTTKTHVCICKACKKEFLVSAYSFEHSPNKFCSHSCRAIWNILHGKKQGTSIEIKIEQELTRRGIVFQKQYPIWQAKTIPDFFIAPNICVYCDGDYWHKRIGIPEKDA